MVSRLFLVSRLVRCVCLRLDCRKMHLTRWKPCHDWLARVCGGLVSNPPIYAPLYIPREGAEQIRFSRGSERVCIYLTNLTTKGRGGSVHNNNKSKNSLYIIYISIFLWMIVAHFLRNFQVIKILRQTNYNSLHRHTNDHKRDCFGRLRSANCVHGAYIYAIRCKS